MSAVFVGREGVLATLGAKLGDAFAEHGSVVVLVGEPGIGKTAIAGAFSSVARERGAVVLSGSCCEDGWQPAYGPWVEALGAYAAACGSHVALAGWLGASAPALAQLIPALRTALADAPEAAPLPPSEARFRLYDAVSRLLAGIAHEAPVLLVIDDLHWADRDTLALLRYVARASARLRLLILGAYRDAGAGDEQRLATDLLAVVRREADFVRIGVGGLEHRRGREVPGGCGPGCRCLRDWRRPSTTRRPATRSTSARSSSSWSTTGRLVDGGSADVRLAELGVPPGVREILARRMLRLSSEARQVLGVACAFSGGFEFPLLAALTGLPEPALLDAIDELLEGGVDPDARATRRPGYDFAHAIVRHALADELNPDRRARLHRRIAVALEAAAGDGARSRRRARVPVPRLPRAAGRRGGDPALSRRGRGGRLRPRPAARCSVPADGRRSRRRRRAERAGADSSARSPSPRPRRSCSTTRVRPSRPPSRPSPRRRRSCRDCGVPGARRADAQGRRREPERLGAARRARPRDARATGAI